MVSTRFGLKNLYQTWLLTERSSSFSSTPVVGSLVAIDDGTVSTLAAKRKSKKTATIASATGDTGKLRLASANGNGRGVIDGIIVQATSTNIVVAAPGEAVPLSVFGSLTQLMSYGHTNILYLSADTDGAATPIPPSPGYYLRRVIRAPKYFSRLTPADLDTASPTALYCMLIEEEAQLL